MASTPGWIRGKTASERQDAARRERGNTTQKTTHEAEPLMLPRLACLITLLAVCCGCSSSTGSGKTSCFSGPIVSVNGDSFGIASCNGKVGQAAPHSVEVKRGQTISITRLTSPTYGSPTSNSPSVLSISVKGTTAHIKAVGTGTALVTIKTQLCFNRAASDACPVLSVTVRA